MPPSRHRPVATGLFFFAALLTATCGDDPTTPQVALTLAFAGDGAGMVTSSPTGLSCSSGDAGPCSASFAQGTDVTLTATGTGTTDVFMGWTGACTGTGTCQLTVDGDATVTATFDDNTVTAEAIGTSGGTVSSPSGSLQLTIPPGALGAETEISVREIATGDLSQDLAALQQQLGFTHAFELGPAGTQFAQPVVLRLTGGAQADVQGTAIQTGLLLLTSGTTTTVPASQTVDIDPATGALTIEGTITHFSQAALTSTGHRMLVQPGSYTGINGTFNYVSYANVTTEFATPLYQPLASGASAPVNWDGFTGCFADGGTQFISPQFSGCQAMSKGAQLGKFTVTVGYVCTKGAAGALDGELRYAVGGATLTYGGSFDYACQPVTSTFYHLFVNVPPGGEGNVVLSNSLDSNTLTCAVNSVEGATCVYPVESVEWNPPIVTLVAQPANGYALGGVEGGTPGPDAGTYIFQYANHAVNQTTTVSFVPPTTSFQGGLNLGGAAGNVQITNNYNALVTQCSYDGSGSRFCQQILEAPSNNSVLMEFLAEPTSGYEFQTTGGSAQPTSDPNRWILTLTPSQPRANFTGAFVQSQQPPVVLALRSVFPAMPYTTSYTVEASDPMGGSLSYTWNMSGESCGTPPVPWTQTGSTVYWSHASGSPDNCSHSTTDHAVNVSVEVRSSASNYVVICSMSGSNTQTITNPSCQTAQGVRAGSARPAAPAPSGLQRGPISLPPGVRSR